MGLMKFAALGSFFLFLPLLVFAQTERAPADISWGNEYKEPSNAFLSEYIASGPNGFYVLREKRTTAFSDGSEIYVELYDLNMDLKRSRDISLKYKNKTRVFEQAIYFGDQLYLFTSFNNKAHKKHYLFYQTLDNERLTPGRKMEMIAEADSDNKNSGSKAFGFHISRDSSKLLVYNQLPYKRKEPERFALRVFNESMEMEWEQDVVLPYPDELFTIEEYRVDKSGNVYMVGVLYEDRARTRRQGKPTYQYVILAYSGDGEEIKEYRIDIPDVFITDLTFRVANNGNLVCSGFYSQKNSYSIKGTYFLRLDAKSKEVLTSNLHEFGFEFLTEYLSDRNRERAKRAEETGNVNRQAELYRYSLDNLVLRSDGGALLVAEQYFIQERTYQTFNGFWERTLYYNYNDIIIVNIRPDGTIEWASRIPKRQVTVDDGGYFSSYAMAIIRDRIVFIYNDNDRNLDPSNNGNRIYNFNGSNSIIAMTEVYIDGSSKTFPLFRNREAAIITRPKFCKQISGRSMVVYGERGRKYKFGRLAF